MAKQKTKTAVKKAPVKKEAKSPVKKLYEGLYSHMFRCRILPDAGEQLEQMMKNKGLKSLNKAINIALREYNVHITEIARLRELINDMENKTDEMETVVTEFQSAISNLQNFKLDKSAKKSAPLSIGKMQSQIGECSECGNDDEPVYKYNGKLFCEVCLEFEME